MYGLLGTIHCLLFMDYMKVYKHKEGRWKISKSFKRYAHFRLPVHRRCLSRSKRCLKTFLGVGPNTIFRIAVNVAWESTHSPRMSHPGGVGSFPNYLNGMMRRPTGS